MMRAYSIEFKIITISILFILALVGYERYSLTQNIMEQFHESKKERNDLLIKTISPIIALNLSLDLHDANNAYLDQLVKQNSEIMSLELVRSDGKLLYHYKNQSTPDEDRQEGYYSKKSIEDPVTNSNICSISISFDNTDYQTLLHKNQKAFFHIFIITCFTSILLIFLIKREFKFLKRLSTEVMEYDPQKNNFNLKESNRKDEVGIIQNAIITMVHKIQNYSIQLEEMNHSLSDKVLERTRELLMANEKLEKLSTTDPLTQLPNRRYLETDLNRVWELAKRNQLPVSIIMCDIDYFKQINDRYGHLIGDFVLKDVANILKSTLKRQTDFVARYGGEEFIIVLYDTKVHAAQELCQEVQSKLKTFNGFEYTGVKLDSVTLSFGIGSVIPTHLESSYDLIQMADLALYQAKKDGRDRIVSYG